MEVLHDSPFVGHVDSVLDRDGAVARVAVMKATFDIAADGTLSVAAEQEPIRHAPVYRGEPGRSSLLHESDGAYHKAGTDVVVIGTAYAPHGKAVHQTEAALSAGTLTKRVAVVGDRQWSWSRSAGAAASPPTPFSEMPICWERAFGGVDDSAGGAAAPGWEARNPVGTGFRVAGTAAALDGVRLPNFEDPRQPISTWRDKPTPQGFGAVDRWWQPRAAYAGTYDDTWKRTRMPVLPLDFDDRFFQAAPADLVHTPHLTGGEPVIAVNLSKRGTERFRIPRLRVTFAGVSEGRRVAVPGVLDTVICLFDSSRVAVVWRAKYRARINEPADPVTARVDNWD